jgi:hypothetical protein
MLTVIECCDAEKYVLPSFIVSKGAAQYMGWHSGTTDSDFVFASSPNGWTDDKLALAWLKHFNDHTEERAEGLPRLLIVDGHGSHVTLEFCEYALAHDIVLFCLPAHSTHLLQPLDVGLFSPLQHYYGKAVDDHMRLTRTGIVKGTFLSFYNQARKQAYTPFNIKAAFRKTGIYPFNPDAVLTKVLPPRPAPVATPARRRAVLIQTPHNRRALRQMTEYGIEMVKDGDMELAIKAFRKISHTAETSMSTADIKAIEAQDLRQKYAGKKAAKTDRKVLTKARVIGSKELIKLGDERLEKEHLAAERAAARAVKKKAAPTPAPQALTVKHLQTIYS